MKALLLPLLLGAAAGCLAALFGVGGGIIMVPAFTLVLGMEYKAAVATSLAVIIPTSLLATWRYSDAGLIDWKIVALTALGACIAAWFATDWMKSLSSTNLSRAFAVVLIAVGIKMLIKPD